MLTRETIVKNSVGLSARPATDFVLKANTYQCSLWLEYRERRINAKSLLGVLSLKIMKNMSVCIVAEGPDEAVALQELAAMLEKEDEELILTPRYVPWSCYLNGYIYCFN